MVNATVNAIHKLKAKMHCKVETVVDAGLQCWTRICLCFDEKTRVKISRMLVAENETAPTYTRRENNTAAEQ